MSAEAFDLNNFMAQLFTAGREVTHFRHRHVAEPTEFTAKDEALAEAYPYAHKFWEANHRAMGHVKHRAES